MNETSGSRVRRIIVQRLVSAGIDKIAVWTFGWFVAWTLYIFVRVLVPSVFLGGPFAVAIFAIGLYVGFTTLTILRTIASHAQNTARVQQLVKLSYGVFGIGFLALLVSTVLWIVELISTN